MRRLWRVLLIFFGLVGLGGGCWLGPESSPPATDNGQIGGVWIGEVVVDGYAIGPEPIDPVVVPQAASTLRLVLDLAPGASGWTGQAALAAVVDARDRLAVEDRTVAWPVVAFVAPAGPCGVEQVAAEAGEVSLTFESTVASGSETASTVLLQLVHSPHTETLQGRYEVLTGLVRPQGRVLLLHRSFLAVQRTAESAAGLLACAVAHASWECSDGVDNDGDGGVDGADRSCWSGDPETTGAPRAWYLWQRRESTAVPDAPLCEEGAFCPGVAQVSSVVSPAAAPVIDSYTLLAPAACGNGVDDDGDGLLDRADPGCRVAPYLFESTPPCLNGSDDDGDGLIDGADPGCGDPLAADESITS